MVLLLLVACPTGTVDCEDPATTEVVIGTGIQTFMDLDEGDDLTIWPVRHDWNRLAWVSARVEELLLEPLETVSVGVGLYQEDVLIGGTFVSGRAPTAHDGHDEYLGLQPRILTENYQDFSGRLTRLEFSLQDGCERDIITAQDVWLWSPEQLCEEQPPPVAQAAVEITQLTDTELTLAVHLTEFPTALYDEYSLREVDVEDGGTWIGGLPNEPRWPSWWTPEEIVFESVVVDLESLAVAPTVTVRVRDSCGRDIIQTATWVE